LYSENATELFEACSGKSYEQALELLAARFPKPNVRDLIRRLPARSDDRAPDIGSPPEVATLADRATLAGTAASRSGSVDRAASLDSPGISPTTAHGPSAQPGPLPAPTRRALEPLSADRYGVHFTADAEFRELLAEVRALASHRHPGGDLMTVMKRGLEAYRRELRKERFAVGCKPRRVTRARATAADSRKKTRHVPAAVTREVYARDNGCCGFVSNEGRRCGARQFLELDHVKPWAEGGETTVENLRLRCRAHNQQAARAHFGSDYIRRAVARARNQAAKGLETR
jgi:5-methylcytosine-specific restriction endonuclease McrA